MIRNLIITAVCITIFAVGCQQKCCLNDPNCRPRPFQPPPPPGPLLLPPANLPTAPGGTVPPGPVVPSVAPSTPGNIPSPFIPSTPPPSFKPAPEVLFPDPLPGGASSRSSSLGSPGPGVLQSPAKPNAYTEPPVAPRAMTGLPDYTKVKDGWASGRRPDLDGFASLKQAGYRTVVYLYPTGADISAVRDVAEKRGLAFLSIETTPERLTTALEAFNAAVADKANRPAYVFDDDGMRSGALWYLHFRSADSMNDDESRVRAKPLGLTDRGAEGQAFALAIQRYLANR
jgi:protein tyrosine phosphatase (PTP) superfamily phosphohydrolase (DUF442 family)